MYVSFNKVSLIFNCFSPASDVWGNSLLRLILNAWESSKYASIKKSQDEDHNENDSEIYVFCNSSLKVKRDIFFNVLLSEFTSWLESQIFLIVKKCFDCIEQLYVRRSLNEVNLEKTGILVFLEALDDFKVRARNKWVKKHPLFTGFDSSSIFNLTASDYLAKGTWALRDVSILPCEIAKAFLIPEVRSNICFFLDVYYYNVVLEGKKVSLRSSFILLVEFDPESIFKFFNLLINSLSIFNVVSSKSLSFEGYKQHTYYSLAVNSECSFLKEYAFLTDLPMVYPPLNWVADNYSHQLFEGGYLSSSILGSRGISPRKRNGKVISNVKPLMVNCLNKLQEQGYKINLKMLNFVCCNYDLSLLHFLKSLNYFDNYHLLLDFLFEFSFKKENSDILIEIRAFLFKSNPINTDLELECNTLVDLIIKCTIEFFLLINLCIEYSLFGKPFYFVFFLDQRFRTYPKASHFFSIHGPSLSKSLIEPVAREDDLDPRLFQELPSIKLMKDDIKSKSHGKHFFVNKNLELNNNVLVYAPVDVTSSGSQIYSGLSGDLNGLKKTNFLVLEKTNQKEDFYSFVLSSFLAKYSDIIKSRFRKIKPSHVLDDLFDLDMGKLFSFFDRNFSKSWIMCYFYSQGHKARVTSLYLKCNKNLIFQYFYMSTNVLFKRELEFIALSFIKTITDLFKNNLKILKFYHSIVDFKNTFVASNLGYFLPGDVNLGLPLLRHIQKPIEDQRISLIGTSNKRSFFSTYTEVNLFDPVSARFSVAANVTHNLDASLCFNTLNEVMSANFPIVPSHDCFFCRVQDVCFVQTAYYDSFIKLILKKDFLLELLLSNTPKESRTFINTLLSRNKVITAKEYKTLLCTNELPSLVHLNLIISSRVSRAKIVKNLLSSKYLMSTLILS